MKEKLYNPAEGFKSDDAQELFIDIKRILLATDGSRSAISATKYAVSMARLFKAKMRAVFVEGGAEAQGEIAKTVDESLKGNGNGRPGYHGLIVAGMYAIKNGISCEEIVEKGNVARRIIESAHEFKPDIIVIGNSEKSGIRRTLGSVVDAVIKGTDVPVLVIRDN